MLELNFHPFPVIETERLTLREFILQDMNDLFDLRNDEPTMRYIGKTMPVSREEIWNLLNRMMDGIRTNSAITWAISIEGNNQVIGHIGFHVIDKDHHRAEIGYLLHSDHWGKGIMSEAVTEVLKYGFETMKLHSVEAKIDPANERSRKLLQKFHFVREAYFKENFYFKGNFLDTEVFSLIAAG